MIAGGDCCVWTESDDCDGADQSFTATATSTLAAAAAAIATTAAPRRMRRCRQRQRSLANGTDTKENSSASAMLPRSTPKDSADGCSAVGKSNGDGGGPFSIASTSGSSSSSASSNCGNLAPLSSSHHHFLPSDFKPQTWLSAVHETVSSTTVRYCSAGAAAALTAVIVIHPLAIIGAVATAAAGAGATAMTMWAVGFFHDLDKGYQIWSSDEFGKLFWRDSDENKTSGKKGTTDDDAPNTIMTEDNSQLFIQEGEVEVQQLVGQPPDQLVTSSLGKMGQALLDEEQKVEEEEEEEGALDLAKGHADNDKAAVATASSSSPERLTIISRNKKHQPSSSRRGCGIQKNRSNLVPSIKPMMMRRIKIQNGILRQKKMTPSTAVGLKDDDSQSFLLVNPSSLTTTATIKRSPSKRTGSTTSSTTSPPPPLVNFRNSIDRYFPPLEICVIHSVKLPGLDSTSQFFNVFFADDAPYSMKDFQKRRGDVDIVYEPWEDCCQCTTTMLVEDDGNGKDELLFSFKQGDGSSDIGEFGHVCRMIKSMLLRRVMPSHDFISGVTPYFLLTEPLPRSATRQRTLKFNTLTKSYFGPAYAKATKVQRVTQLQNDRILVIENVTQLAEIPFSDRFRVLERWILEVVEEGDLCETPSTSKDSATPSAASTEFETVRTKTACKLAVYAEMQMLKPCSWEPQIRKKASETFTDVATDWCKSAVVALAATEEQKRKRQRLEIVNRGGKVDVDNGKSSSGRRPPRIPSPMTVVVADALPPPSATAIIPPSLVRERSQLFAEHKRNFDELDKLIAQGDLERCSVEVTHSSHLEYYSSNIRSTSDENEDAESKLSQSSAFATVLENPEVDEYEITSSIAGSSIADGDDDETNKDGSHRKAAVMMRTKSLKLFRRLSSRGAPSKSTAQPISDDTNRL